MKLAETLAIVWTQVFEEIANLDFPFEGIPTVPPRKDVDHLTFFCAACRYRVSAKPEDTVAKVNKESFALQPSIHCWGACICLAHALSFEKDCCFQDQWDS